MAKYLDESGFSHVWNKIKALLAGKQDNLTAGDGISIANNVISATGGGGGQLTAGNGIRIHNGVIDNIACGTPWYISISGEFQQGLPWGNPTNLGFGPVAIKWTDGTICGNVPYWEECVSHTVGFAQSVQLAQQGPPIYELIAPISPVKAVKFQKIGNDGVWTREEIDLGGTPEIQTADSWKYRIYADGTFEAWYKATGQSLTINNASGNLYRSNLTTLTLPAAINAVSVQHASVNVAHSNYPCWGMLASLGTSSFNYYAMSGGSRSASPNYLVTAHVFGECG